MNLPTYLSERQRQIESALEHYANDATIIPSRLRESMRYSLLAGGKRLRPILVMAGCEALGGDSRAVVPCACALEMIHTFSLIHDDLPAMDNDDLRRGQPTNHKIYGDGMAILAGDGLLAEAFSVIARTPNISAEILVTVLREIADATGGRGMVAGQAIDILSEQRTLSQTEVEELHAHKTGALIRVAVVSGARLAGANEEAVAQLTHYGRCIGLSFQIADDLLSIESTPETLGKPVGNDAARAKATFPAMMGVAAARARMESLTREAVESVTMFGDAAAPLCAIAEYVVGRKT